MNTTEPNERDRPREKEQEHREPERRYVRKQAPKRPNSGPQRISDELEEIQDTCEHRHVTRQRMRGKRPGVTQAVILIALASGVPLENRSDRQQHTYNTQEQEGYYYYYFHDQKKEIILKYKIL